MTQGIYFSEPEDFGKPYPSRLVDFILIVAQNDYVIFKIILTIAKSKISFLKKIIIFDQFLGITSYELPSACIIDLYSMYFE